MRPFTLTVIADDRHLATWVDGDQVTDWSDDRPADDNPRRGLRTRAGTIQLQAHDPQTDVEFRSVRVDDLGDRGPGGTGEISGSGGSAGSRSMPPRSAPDLDGPRMRRAGPRLLPPSGR